MATSILSLLVAIFKAIPALKALWDETVTLYVNSQIESMKRENLEAIRKAIYDYDQRALEQITTPHPGEESHLPGTEQRDPRVREP